MKKMTSYYLHFPQGPQRFSASRIISFSQQSGSYWCSTASHNSPAPFSQRREVLMDFCAIWYWIKVIGWSGMWLRRSLPPRRPSLYKSELANTQHMPCPSALPCPCRHIRYGAPSCWALRRPPHQFPSTALTNRHKLGSSWCRNLFFHSSRVQKSKTKVLTGPCSLQRL